MDTLTHTLTAIGLSKLALLSPEIAADPAAQQGIFWSVMVGSQVPDLDIVLRLKSDTAYLKYHRGISHSFPVQFFTALWAASLLHFLFPAISWEIIYLWTLASSSIHIMLDLLTSYGTQAFLPFTDKKIACDILMIIDFPILIMLFLGITLTNKGMPPGLTHLAVFMAIALYVLSRCYFHKKLIHLLEYYFGPGIQRLSLIPTFYYHIWDFVLEKDHEFYHGDISISADVNLLNIRSNQSTKSNSKSPI